MRSAIYKRYGGPEVLEIEESPAPSPKSGEVLLEIAGTSVNPIDWKLRSGAMRFLRPLSFPVIPGGDVAGVVRELGEGVSSVKVGDRVILRVKGLPLGTSAEYICAKADLLAPWPSTMSAEEAAAIPLAGLTAYQGLVHQAKLKAGDRALVVGASGGVGHYAVQIVKAMGGHVTGVCSTRNLELVRSLGADEVIDYTTGAPLTSGGPYDIIYDAVGGYKWSRLTKGLKKSGTVVTPIPTSIGLGLLGALITGRYKVVMVKGNGPDLSVLSKWAEGGQLRTHLDSTFALEDIAAAHRRSEEGRARGKIAVTVTNLD